MTRRADLVIAGLIGLATVAYLATLPRDLNYFDESLHLYDAKRVLEGGVMYRDVWNFTTPAYFYVMAALFGVFGTSVATARVGSAVMHAAAAALLYLTARRLGVRRGLAGIAPLGHVVMCQSAWPIASHHWLGTLFHVAVFWACARGLEGRAAALALAGVAEGLLIATQQRGAFVGVGVAAWLLLDAGVRRRYRVPGAGFVSRLAWFTAGALAVLVPLFALLIRGAGLPAVWDALVRYPLQSYPSTHRHWGGVPTSAALAANTFPLILTYLPAVLVLTAGRLGWLLFRGRDARAARRATLVLAAGASAVATIAYAPDIVRLAYVAPILLVAVALEAEALVRVLPTGRTVTRLGWAAAATAVVLSVAHLERNRERLRAATPIHRETAFGGVDFASAADAELVDTVARLMRDAPSRYLYEYPVLAHLYLVADAENPTPYGFFAGSTSPAAQVQAALLALARHPPSYVVLFGGVDGRRDPVGAWILARYEPLPGERFGAFTIYRPAVPPRGGDR